MEITQVSDKKKRPNKAKKSEVLQDTTVENNTSMKTVIERKTINANWEAFLQTQSTETCKKNKEINSGARNNNSYWKTKRLERKHNLLNMTHINTADIDRITDSRQNLDAKIDENINSNKNDKHRNELQSSSTHTTNSNTVHMANPPAGVNSNVSGGRVGTLTRCVGIDCEMVGIGPYGRDSILARVSLVNKFGDCIYDKFVKPREKVTDYRTPVSGVRKEDLQKGETFQVVQREVAEIIKGRILVGHAIKKDLEVLYLSHPKRYIRDTSRYKPFRKLAMGGTPSLKNLSRELLGVKIQSGEHSSVEDARATMQLYAAHQRQWESAVKRKKGGAS